MPFSKMSDVRFPSISQIISFLYDALLLSAMLLFWWQLSIAFSSLCCKCRAQYSRNNLLMTLWNPLKIAASMSTPTFFRSIRWGLAEISSTQNFLKVPSSLVKCIIMGPRCTGFFIVLLLRSPLLR